MPSRWSAKERLELVDVLQARSGSESESFFDAHDLGKAYRSAGDKNSKRAKINAALYAAERRGDLEEVLDAAAERFLGRQETDAGTAPSRADVDKGVRAVPTTKRIFLSHATADRPLADLLRNTLVLGGVPHDRLFYSSDRATGIPSGEDVGAYLRRSIQEAGFVIELITETFMTRPICLMELGGAWALGTPTCPIVVPPLTREEAVRQIGNVQMGVLSSDAEIDGVFDELHDRLVENLAIPPKVASWNQAIREFKERLPLRLPAAQT